MCWVWAGAGFTDTRPSSGGVGHLNKSLQCSEVSANRASVTGGAPGDRAAHSSWERGVRSEKTTPAKTTPKGCHLSRVLKRGLCSLGRRPWRLLWGWQQPLETALCVPEATSPQVLGTGRGRGGGTPLGVGGEVVTCCSEVISKASRRSHSLLCGSSVPRWLSKAGPRPSAGLGGGVGAAPCSLSPSPAGYPTIICWFELYPPKWHCLLTHIGNSVMTGYDPPPPPYLILISPALHFAINDSKPAK